MENTDIMVPARGQVLKGIIRRQRIQELLDQGYSKPQIAGELNISSQAINRYIQQIKSEQASAEKQEATG